ncbi:MAG TPA: hypothetical protein VGO11_08365 [Chthoniobacteraceae bacterium]|nr:hypothetical protein [Chthoniobacteraceae bacterium]
MNRSSFRIMRPLIALAALFATGLAAHAAVLWMEGENPVKAGVKRMPFWYDKVIKSELSGGDFISNWGAQPGEIEYSVTAPAAGEYEFRVRANPLGAKLSFQLNDAPVAEIDLAHEPRENVNIAADAKPDLRFLAWVHVGHVALKQGANTIVFRMHSDNNNHGMLDCFVLANEPFEPHGISKPGELAKAAAASGEWSAFAPPADPFTADAGLDLRSLNEAVAGEGGFIAARDGHFVHSNSGQTVRFWGVNSGPQKGDNRQSMAASARMLAKHGVNCVRVLTSIYDKYGEIEPDRVQQLIDLVETHKAEGIYTIFSIYWFHMLTPKTDDPILTGYDGKTNPIEVLFFNPEFQKKYQTWWTALLTTPGKVSGKRLIDDPAVAGLEVQNEDGMFWWSFGKGPVPEPQMRTVEKLYGDWLIKKYGSLDAAASQWKGRPDPRDNPGEGRMGFRNYWNVFHERQQRDKDGVTFLAELQRQFYQQMIGYFRTTGFKGVICTSGWTTADPQYLGPIDKYTNVVADYIDRHGYVDCARKGPNQGWAVMKDQTYYDRSILRFDAEAPGKPKLFSNPVMDPHYDHKPSFISETSVERPNRYRSEAPLYFACYGALQDSGGFAHFALDGNHWSAKPGFFMQPWTLMAPDSMGQFPAAALIFRQGLVAVGEVLVDLNLKIADIENLKGTPLPQNAALDALGLQAIPTGTTLKPDSVIDPLVHYAGRADVRFTETGGPAKLVDLAPFINRPAQTVTSSTKELELDYGKGILTINAPAAQGISGDLQAAGATETADLSISSDLDLGHIIAVSLDGKPLATSGKILLQVMSEDKASQFHAEPSGNGLQRIVEIGRDPWQIKNLSGVVKFKRADAAALKVTALDFNGYRKGAAGTAAEIKLQADTVYYLVER